MVCVWYVYGVWSVCGMCVKSLSSQRSGVGTVVGVVCIGSLRGAINLHHPAWIGL